MSFHFNPKVSFPEKDALSELRSLGNEQKEQILDLHGYGQRPIAAFIEKSNFIK